MGNDNELLQQATDGTRPEHVQKACDVINSIESNLVSRLADIEATLQPAAVARLRWHIITALGDHIEAIARLAAQAPQPDIRSDETIFGDDGLTVDALAE
jgi:hypothetical protein